MERHFNQSRKAIIDSNEVLEASLGRREHILNLLMAPQFVGKLHLSARNGK